MIKISNSNKNNVSVRRVKVSEQAESVLEQIAKTYGCTYNGKLSISGLLSQIADGRLKVSRTELPLAQNLASSNSPLELEIEVHSNLNGTIAEIAKTIAEFEGNICKAKARENSKSTYIRVVLDLPEEKNLAGLVKSLEKITIKDVFNYNKEDKIKKLLVEIKSDTEDLYNAYNTLHKNNSSFEDFFYDPENQHLNLNQKLIKNIVITLGFEIGIEHTSGTLKQLTRQIAERAISISSINITTNDDEAVNIIKLGLGFSPEEIQVLKSTKDFMVGLKENLKCITYINPLSVECLD